MDTDGVDRFDQKAREGEAHQKLQGTDGRRLIPVYIHHPPFSCHLRHDLGGTAAVHEGGGGGGGGGGGRGGRRGKEGSKSTAHKAGGLHVACRAGG